MEMTNVVESEYEEFVEVDEQYAAPYYTDFDAQEDPTDYAFAEGGVDSCIIDRNDVVPPAVVPQVESSGEHGLSLYQINALPVTGIYVDGDFYYVSGPQIDRPEYIAQATMDHAAHSLVKAQQVLLFPKWNGSLRVSVVCYNDECQFSLRFEGTRVTRVSREPPSYGEVMTDNRYILFDGEGKMHTSVVNDIDTISKLGSDVDGVIVQVDNTQYRAKYEKTFDLVADRTGFLSAEKTIIFPPAMESCKVGQVYEVDKIGRPLHPRTDKRNAQSNFQVHAIQAGLTFDEMRSVFSSVHTGYCVLYHMSYYIWQLEHMNYLNSSLDLIAISVVFKDFDLPYSYDEILHAAKKVIKDKGDRKLVDQASADGFFLELNVKKPLTITDFLSAKLWTKYGYAALKRKLLELGFFFVNMDLTLLVRKFLRGVDRIYYVTPNKYYRPYIHPLVCINPPEEARPDGQLLPYHAAAYDDEFFRKHKYFDVRVNFVQYKPVHKPKLPPLAFCIESAIGRMLLTHSHLTVSKVSNELLYPKSMIMRVLARSTLYCADECGKYVLRR